MVYFYSHRRIYVGDVAGAMLCSVPACSHSWGRVKCFSLRFWWRGQSCPMSALLSPLVVTVEVKVISCCSTISGSFVSIGMSLALGLAPPVACLWSKCDEYLVRRSCAIGIRLSHFCFVPSRLELGV